MALNCMGAFWKRWSRGQPDSAWPSPRRNSSQPGSFLPKRNGGTFPRSENRLPLRLCLALQRRHERVVVVRFMVEQGQPVGTGGTAELDALDPGRMSPTDFAGEFLLGVGRVIDDQIGPGDKVQDMLIRLA